MLEATSSSPNIRREEPPRSSAGPTMDLPQRPSPVSLRPAARPRPLLHPREGRHYFSRPSGLNGFWLGNGSGEGLRRSSVARTVSHGEPMPHLISGKQVSRIATSAFPLGGRIRSRPCLVGRGRSRGALGKRSTRPPPTALRLPSGSGAILHLSWHSRKSLETEPYLTAAVI